MLLSEIDFNSAGPLVPLRAFGLRGAVDRARYIGRLGRSLALHTVALPFVPDYRLMPSDSQAVTDFKMSGWCRFSLRPESLAAVMDSLVDHIDSLREFHDSTPPSRRTFLHSGLAIERERDAEVFGVVEEQILGECAPLVEALLGGACELRFVKLAYFDAADSTMFDYGGGSRSPYAPWHVDMNINELKVNLYLTDVGQAQGPMRYVTGSHLLHVGALFDRSVIHAHRWGWRSRFADSWMNHERARRVFSSLPRPLRKKNIVGDCYDSAWPQFEQRFAGRVETLLGAAGTGMLFESLGLHMGGDVQEGSRLAVQATLGPRLRSRVGLRAAILRGVNATARTLRAPAGPPSGAS